MDLRGYKKYIFDPEAFLRRKAKFFASQGSSLPTRLERSCWPLDASKRERRQARLAQHGKTARASKAQAMLPTHGTFQEALKKTQMAFSSWPSLIDPPASPPCLLKKISFTLTSRKAKGLEALEHSLRLPPLRLLPPFRLSVFRLPPPSPYGWLASSPPLANDGLESVGQVHPGQLSKLQAQLEETRSWRRRPSMAIRLSRS